MTEGQQGSSRRRRGRHRRSRSGWQKAGVAVLSTLLAVVLAAGAALGVLWWRGEASLDRLAVEGLERVRRSMEPDADVGATPAPGQDGQPELSEPFVVLVAGLDGDASGLTAEEQRRVALGGEREGDRPDTIILVRVDPGRDQLALLSLPRDLLVRRCDGSRGKINGAYEIGTESGTGGPTCLVQTITRHTGIAIQHYVEVSFAGFLDVIDAVGGVRMSIPTALSDEKAKLDLQPGCQVLDGPDALAYVRVRGIDNDFGRMARQQAFASELLEEVTSAGILANPLRLYRLVGAAAGAVDVDDALGLSQMRHIAESLRDLTPDRLAAEAITGTITTREDLGGASVVEEDRSVTAPLYRAFRTGGLTAGLPGSEPAPTAEPTAAPTPTPTPAIVDAADVGPVDVRNAEGTAGLAAEVADLLAERGFMVGEVADATVTLERSVVHHGPGLAAEARTVAQALGGLPIRERLDLPGADAAGASETADAADASEAAGVSGIVVMVGADLDPAAAEDVRGSATPSPGVTPSPSASASPDTTLPSAPEPTETEYAGIPTDAADC